MLDIHITQHATLRQILRAFSPEYLNVDLTENLFFLFPLGPKSWTWEEMSWLRQGRISNGTSQSREEVLA